MLENLISQQNIDAIRQVVEKGNRFVVLAHKNPDGDAVGSTLAMCHYLRSVGKEAVVVLPNAFPAFLAWLPGADAVMFYDTDKERCDNAIAAAASHTNKLFDILLNIRLIFNLLTWNKMIADDLWLCISCHAGTLDHNPLSPARHKVSQ